MQVFTSFSYPFTVAGASKMKSMPVPTLRFLQWVLYPAFDIHLSSADMSPAFLTLAEAPSWIVRLQSSLLWTGALGLVEAQVLLVFLTLLLLTCFSCHLFPLLYTFITAPQWSRWGTERRFIFMPQEGRTWKTGVSNGMENQLYWQNGCLVVPFCHLRALTPDAISPDFNGLLFYSSSWSWPAVFSNTYIFITHFSNIDLFCDCSSWLS